jgi:hypothetical protein
MSDVLVTDHALVRWLERVHGIDMEFFRRELERHVAWHASTGWTFACIEGSWYRFDGGVLVTVLPHGRAPASSGRAKQRPRRLRRFRLVEEDVA